MLCKFTVNNFKSLINVTYEPGAVNLLVGVNNSGKTNLCQALRFLSRTARKQEETLWSIRHDVIGSDRLMHNVYFDHPTIDLGCTCKLMMDGETLTFHSFEAFYEDAWLLSKQKGYPIPNERERE